MSGTPPPIIFHFINPNELEKDKIKILKLKKYNTTDTFEILIQSLLKKYKRLYSKEPKLYIGDFTIIYEGMSLQMNMTLDKINIANGEPFILLLNTFENGTISLHTALSVMNMLFPEHVDLNMLNTTNANSNSNSNSNNININTNVSELSITKDIQTLMDMGFSESIAKTAIQNTNSLQEAIDLLLGSN